MEVRIVATGDIARRLAEAMLDLLREAPAPAACLVFANTPATARLAHDRLRELITDGSAELLLLTGRTREREAEQTRARILDPVHGMASTRPAGISRQRHLIVIATQTLEVGADIDSEYLVTEACGVRALTQRLGRLNRLGRHTHARAFYVHLPPKPPKTSRKAAAHPNVWPGLWMRTRARARALEERLQRWHGQGEPAAVPCRRNPGSARRRPPAGRRRCCAGSCGNG